MITLATRGISSTIGLAREKHFDHKERKAALAGRRQTDSSDPVVAIHDPIGPTEKQSETTCIENDTSVALRREEEHDREAEAGRNRTVDELVQSTMASRLPDIATDSQTRLPYPVIIPQRRPGDKSRGFARAYPPDLERFGIDQDTFLQFLKSFHSASHASPVLYALYVAASAISPIAGLTTFAVSISVTMTLEWVPVNT